MSSPGDQGVIDLTGPDEGPSPQQTSPQRAPSAGSQTRTPRGDREAIDVEAEVAALASLPQYSAPYPMEALPSRGPLAQHRPGSVGGILHQPQYLMCPQGGTPLPLPSVPGVVHAHPYVPPLNTRPHVPEYARTAVATPYLELTLLNSKEISIETDSLRNLIDQKATLKILDSSPDVRFDGEKNRWICPLSSYEGICYALHNSGAVVSQLPRSVLAALSLSARRRGEEGAASAESDRENVLSQLKSMIPGRLLKALAPFQREGVVFALKNEGKAFIADEMGLGKTIQALAIAAAYAQEWPVLVVCPSGARYHWRAEILQWLAPDLVERHDPQDIVLVESGSSLLLPPKTEKNQGAFKFLIISYSLVSKLQTQLENMNFKVAIVDESHYLKNHRARRTICLEGIVRKTARSVLLSGTPALSRPMELFSQLHALQPDVWPSREEFKYRYCKTKVSGNGKMSHSGARNTGELHALLLGTVMIRRLKSDIMTDMPAKKRIVDLLHMAPCDASRRLDRLLAMVKLLNKKKGRALPEQSLEEAYGKQPDAAPNVQLAEAPSDVIPSETVENIVDTKHDDKTPGEQLQPIDKKRYLLDLYALSGEAKVEEVLKRIETFLADPQSGKLVVFGHHRVVMDRIGDYFDTFRRSTNFIPNISRDNRSSYRSGIFPFNYIRIDGQTLPKQRHDNVTRFQTDVSTRVALLSITAAGVALTLTAAATVFFAELYWTPGSLLQAEDRVHRIGQTADVKIYYLLAKNSIDELLWPLVRKKLQTLGNILDGSDNVDFHLHDSEVSTKAEEDRKETSISDQLGPLEKIIIEIAKSEEATAKQGNDSESDSDDRLETSPDVVDGKRKVDFDVDSVKKARSSVRRDESDITYDDSMSTASEDEENNAIDTRVRQSTDDVCSGIGMGDSTVSGGSTAQQPVANQPLPSQDLGNSSSGMGGQAIEPAKYAPSVVENRENAREILNNNFKRPTSVRNTADIAPPAAAPGQPRAPIGQLPLFLNGMVPTSSLRSVAFPRFCARDPMRRMAARTRRDSLSPEANKRKEVIELD